jgi:hypothetical protein
MKVHTTEAKALGPKIQSQEWTDITCATTNTMANGWLRIIHSLCCWILPERTQYHATALVSDQLAGCVIVAIGEMGRNAAIAQSIAVAVGKLSECSPCRECFAHPGL